MTIRRTLTAAAVGISAVGMSVPTSPAVWASEPASAETSLALPDDPDSDAAANELTRRHNLEQSFTVRRTVDGKVFETIEETVSLDGTTPTLPTEAAGTIEQRLKNSFDRLALTRPEALDEARLNFALGDVDRDGRMSEAEFVRLLDLIQSNGFGAGDPMGLSGEAGRVDDAGADTPALSFADFLDLKSGPDGVPATPLVDEQAFALGFLRQFDAADDDANAVLSGDELRRFRRVFGA